MQTFRLTATALGLSAAMGATGLAATNTMNHVNNAMSAHSMTINLGAQNGSKQDGQAFLNDTSGGLKVKLQVKNEPSRSFGTRTHPSGNVRETQSRAVEGPIKRRRRRLGNDDPEPHVGGAKEGALRD